MGEEFLRLFIQVRVLILSQKFGKFLYSFFTCQFLHSIKLELGPTLKKIDTSLDLDIMNTCFEFNKFINIMIT